jgi:two-component system, chemotaxis family, protein-glutamate methylesterase/glutaminase
MVRCDGVLALGGSAGGIEALVELVAGLPADLPVPVLVTVHVGENVRSNLPRILARAGPLPAAHPRQGEPLEPGRIYVAPPGLHLLAASGAVRLSSGPRVNRHRPAVDVMFASAARWGGRCAVAVVLSGLLDDGAVGAALVARGGGQVIVQDPADAIFGSMPRAALAAVPEATTAPTGRLGEAIVETLGKMAPRDTEEGGEPEMADAHMGDTDDPGFLAADETRLTRLTCPECNGGLAEIQLGSRIRYFRCHVGHQYSPQSLEAAQREAAEAKLWAAAAALEEHAAMARHLATHREEGVENDAAADYREAADRSTRTARSLLSGLTHRQAGLTPLPPVPPAGSGHLA